MTERADETVRMFAEWLTLIQQEAAEEGIVLMSRKDEREAALYKQVAATGRAA